MLVTHTERVLADLEAAEAGVAELSSTVQGVLTVAAFPTAARALVSAAIARCRAEHPDLRMRLTEQEQAIDALKAGDVDIALVYAYNLLPRLREPGVEIETLVEEPLLAALPADVRLPDGPIARGELAARPWIAAQRDDELRVMLERACGLAGFAPALDYTSSDYTVIALVEAGLGVLLVPRLALESISTHIQFREIAEPALSRTISAATRAGSDPNPPIAAVLAALRTVAAEI